MIITKEMILKRLKIGDLPDQVALTNLDFIQGETPEGEDKD